LISQLAQVLSSSFALPVLEAIFDVAGPRFKWRQPRVRVAFISLSPRAAIPHSRRFSPDFSSFSSRVCGNDPHSDVPPLPFFMIVMRRNRFLDARGVEASYTL